MHIPRQSENTMAVQLHRAGKHQLAEIKSLAAALDINTLQLEVAVSEQTNIVD